MANGKNRRENYYTDDRDGFCYHSLRLDRAEKAYEYRADHPSYQETPSGIELKGDFFFPLLEYLKKNYRNIGSQAEDDPDFAENPAPEKRQISEEDLQKGLQCLLTKAELDKIIGQSYPEGEYYDLDILMNGIHRYLNGEIAPAYYRKWCALWSCLLDENVKATAQVDDEYTEKKVNMYAYLSGRLDWESRSACRSAIPNMRRWLDVKDLIADLKWCDHRIINAKNHTEKPFDNGGILVYVGCVSEYGDDFFPERYYLNEFYDVDDEAARERERLFFVADRENRRYNFAHVHEPIFEEDVNYIRVSDSDVRLYRRDYFEFTRLRRDYALDLDFGLKYIPKSAKK